MAVGLNWNFSSNARSFNVGLDKSVVKFKEDFRKKVERIVRFVHQSLISKTPVHTGLTVRNYIWSIKAPNTSGPMRPAGGGLPGPTNTMPLGPEPRRPANEALATATLHGLDFSNPYQRYIVTNIGPAILGLERGQFPLPPLIQRSPKGMFALTLSETMARLSAGRL